MSKIHLLVLTILSVFLVNLESNNAHSIQDSLPSLVLDDENSSSLSSNPASQSDLSASKKTPTDENTDNLDRERERGAGDSKVIPYKTDKREEQPAPTAEQPKESSVESTKETTSHAPNAADSTTISKPAEETPTSKAPEKDINVLLANKDDAENDLASPPDTNSNPAPSDTDAGRKTSVVITSGEEKKIAELDSPVDTKRQNDDRLHYSFSNTESNKPSVEKKEVPKEEGVGYELAPEKPVEEKKSEEADKKPVEEKRERAKSDTANSPGSRDQKEEEEDRDDSAANGSDKELGGKRDTFDEKSKPDEAPKEPAPATKTEAETKAQSPTNEQAVVSSTIAETSSTEQPALSTANTKSDTRGKKDEPAIVSKKEGPEGDELSKKASAEASTTVLPKTTASPSTTTTATDLSTTKAVKPASVPSILAVALGTALGAAVNPIINNKSDKKPPIVASLPAVPPTTTSTTTKTPSSTTKKSSIDRWDRWSTTPPSTLSTSTSGPTRRRPILPSIRRRFRPYNRFSPFPWGGADAYSPDGYDPDFSPSTLAPETSLSSTTKKPSRRRPVGESSFTVKPTVFGGSPNPTSSEDDDDGIPVRPESSTRRRHGNGNRRRHHHNHRNNDGAGTSEQQPSHRRRVHPYHNNRHHDRDERPQVDTPSLFDSPQPRPISPGFGLFNAGSQTGSGFDLSNPFSGWYDETGASSDRPQRPPSRVPPALSPTSGPLGNPRPPVAVEGDYDDQYGGRHEHDHHHHHHGRPHNGRDDYEHDHHHDCHDHDYDHHRDPYRPNRPHRDREPIRPPVGGYDDNYTPPGGYGRRPARPYNRRDQAEQDRTSNRERESSEASPSLYGGRVGALTPVAPRRVPSIFSPFDSLFGSIDDGLFSLRSSFIDSPLRAADSVHTFDTVVSSPQISKQTVEQASPSLSSSSSAPNLNNKESSGDKNKEVRPIFSFSNSAENNTNDPFSRGAIRAFG